MKIPPKTVAIIGHSLLTGLTLNPAKPFTPPAPKPTISPAQAQRLQLNQVLVTLLESNTRILCEQGVWPGKADKLVGALHHRINELYDRFYQYTGEEGAHFLNNLTGLTEVAAVSILLLASENNAANTPPMYALLTQLAELAGLELEDPASDSPAAEAA